LGQIAKTNNYFKLNKENYRLVIDEGAHKLLGNFPIDMASVRVTKENYNLAVMSFDSPFTCPDNEFWTLAMEYTYQYLAQYIPISRPQFKDLYMDFSTGAGFPWNLFFPTKGDIPEDMIETDLNDPYTPYYWNLAMKKEKLPIVKIKENKMRSFMMPSVTYLIRQKKYSQNFNEFLKLVPWSAYGFNWHYKGFHRSMSPFLKFININEYDVRYWDKHFPLKKACVDLRRRFLDLTPDEEEEFYRLAQDEIHPKIVLPSGEVIELDVGQCSGSENTTSDNTIAHIMIIMYECIKGYYTKYRSIPTLEQILENVYNKIYSDDVVQGYKDEFDFIGDPIQKDAIFKEFGMAIEYMNPEKWKVFKGCIGATFLGMTIHDYFGVLVPTYPYHKILNSSVIREDDETPSQQLVRFTALLTLLTFTNDYETYRKFILAYIKYYDLEEIYIPIQARAQAIELCKESVNVVGGRNKISCMSDDRLEQESGSQFNRTLRRCEAISRTLRSRTSRENDTTRKVGSYQKGRPKITKSNVQKKYPNNKQIRSRGNRYRTGQVSTNRGTTSNRLGRRRGYSRGNNFRNRGNRGFRKNSNNRSPSIKGKYEKGTTTINRRMGFETPMPFFKSNTRTKGEDGMLLTGSEFLTTVQVNSTAHGYPTRAGDVIGFIPLSPIFIPGTRLYKLSQAFKHYKFKKVTFEYVPIVPSTQNGALLMLCTYDPIENFTLVPDFDSRVRIAMAHKDANMFNVITYGRSSLSQSEDTLKYYETGVGEDERLECQGVWILMAGSTYSPFDQTATTITLGQIVMHYEVELSVRDLIDIPTPIATVMNTISATGANLFVTMTAEDYMEFKGAGVNGFPGLLANQIMIFTVYKFLNYTGTAVQVYDYHSEGYNAFSEGMVLFGYTEKDDGTIHVCSSIDTATNKSKEQCCIFATTYNTASTYTAIIHISIYNMSDDD